MSADAGHGEVTRDTTVELVRHAHARSRRAWSPRDDRTRPLDESGRAQAAWLTERLAGDDVAAVVTSPAARCADTVRPLAAALACPFVTDERLADLREVPVTDHGSGAVLAAWLAGRSMRAVDDAAARWPGRRIVVCSHGDVLSALLALVSARDDVPVVATARAGLRKGAWVTLRFADGRCVAASPHAAAPGSTA